MKHLPDDDSEYEANGLAEGRRRAEEGAERAHAAATEAWKILVSEALEKVITTQSRFTSADIWNQFPGGRVPEGADGRALAGILKKYQKAEMIEPTGGYVPCVRSSRHAAPIRVWRSHVVGQNLTPTQEPTSA